MAGQDKALEIHGAFFSLSLFLGVLRLFLVIACPVVRSLEIILSHIENVQFIVFSYGQRFIQRNIRCERTLAAAH